MSDLMLILDHVVDDKKYGDTHEFLWSEYHNHFNFLTKR